jgi:regulator of protease activity HflC (stomatin/prohibitin superfamily)
MKKATLLFALAVAAISFTSCRGYEREQDRLDRESEGKGELLKAESTKKVKIEQAKADLESAKLDAQTKVTEATAAAQTRIIKAKAEAEERIISAGSKAKANRLISESVTPQLIDYMKTDRWNGKLPTVVGAGSNTIIDLK